MVKNQIVAAFGLVGLLASLATFAAEPGVQPGFYGGVSLREAGTEAAGVDFGHLASTWGRFASPVSDDVTARRTLVFGGYRFANDIAVEGSLTSADSYALRPFDGASPRGVGLSLAGGPDAAMHAWNANLYTSWGFLKSFSLYGRLGYARDSQPAYALAALPASDVRRLRDGVNYGVGVRYDITSALGLRLEYARFPHFTSEGVTGPLPDSDQVQFGMQFRF